MPRTARASKGNICYHVINRGNGHAAVFHKRADYVRFTEMMHQSCDRLPLRVVGWCLMPNHIHLVLWPHADGDLSRWMQWLLTCHVRRYHHHYGSDGHVWQGRFKAFPIQHDTHYLSILHYVEANPLRTGLVERAEEWEWSSLHALVDPARYRFLADGPVARPYNWLSVVNECAAGKDSETIRNCIDRGSPFGDDDWVRQIAVKLGLESAVRPKGRPPKVSKK